MKGLTRRQRVFAGVFGQAYMRLVNALNTVVLVPILIGAWGLEGFGEWVALTALASYFAYSNFGIVTTSANEIVMAIGAHDEQGARRAFQMSINIALYVVFPILLGIVAFVAFLPISSFLNLTVIDPQSAFFILAVTAGQLWISTIRGILLAVLYSTGSYGVAYFLTGTTKFLELSIVSALILIWGGQQTSVVVAVACVSIVDVVIIYLVGRQLAPWARFNMRIFDISWLKGQLKPAIGFALSNFSTQGVIVQGPRIILSATLGPAAVAIYTVYGTAMRLVDQLLLMVALPLEVEIAQSVGKNDKAKAYSLIVFGTQIGWLLFGAVTVGFIFFGNLIFSVWTHDRVVFNVSLMAMFLIMSGCNQIGRISAHALIATNRMYGPSIIVLVGCLVGLMFGGVLTSYFGLSGMASGIIIAELFCSLIIVKEAMSYIGYGPLKFFKDIFKFHMIRAHFQ